MNKKITGINKHKHDSYSSDYVYGETTLTLTLGLDLKASALISNDLKPPVDIESESVEVEWIIE